MSESKDSSLNLTGSRLSYSYKGLLHGEWLYGRIGINHTTSVATLIASIKEGSVMIEALIVFLNRNSDGSRIERKITSFEPSHKQYTMKTVGDMVEVTKSLSKKQFNGFIADFSVLLQNAMDKRNQEQFIWTDDGIIGMNPKQAKIVMGMFVVSWVAIGMAGFFVGKSMRKK